MWAMLIFGVVGAVILVLGLLAHNFSYVAAHWKTENTICIIATAMMVVGGVMDILVLGAWFFGILGGLA